MRSQKGFTLIEIVMVLVLLGILAAVAVPKYFDLQKEAEEKAMDAHAAEAMARFNGALAEVLVKGFSTHLGGIKVEPTCSNAMTNGMSEATVYLESIKEQYPYSLTGAGEDEMQITLTSEATKFSKTYLFKLPDCNK